MTSLSRRSLMGGCAAGAMLAVTASTGARASAGTADPVALQAAISDLSHPPATSAQLRVGDQGTHWYGTAGVSDIRSGHALYGDDRFRAGSVTKAFVATVVLQLWARHRVDLDAPIGRYLRDLLPSSSARITVTQLLNHTSGLPDHQGLPDLSTPEAVLRHRGDRWTPQELVRTVTHSPLKFPPGTKQEYRGINYVLLALLIEELTGRHYGEAIKSLILRPLNLTRTLLPGDDPHLHGPHVHGYLRMTDKSLQDITTYEQSSSWGEGELISSADDLFRFQEALFSGVLLPPEAMSHLFALPPASVHMVDGSPARYSMGLQTATVNGVTFWGKTGDTYGYRTRMFATRDLRLRFVLSYTPTPLAASEDMINRVVTLLTT
ncbi:serine hydrolase domain-containing protein [Streptomyces canus]|uniref:serine hydrolase domain-containing protein n=1 Tax=Streptomyces canus TaxID=58343 RepID=UPI002DD7FCCA|nr:serine hydrolase domain-containing protein [Streptomyces canus]